MSSISIETISKHAENVFIDLGFNKISVNSATVYEHAGNYYKLSYIKGLDGFVIESAESLEEARKNRFEDDDIYPISLGETGILDLLKDDLVKHYLKD